MYGTKQSAYNVWKNAGHEAQKGTENHGLLTASYFLLHLSSITLGDNG